MPHQALRQHMLACFTQQGLWHQQHAYELSHALHGTYTAFDLRQELCRVHLATYAEKAMIGIHTVVTTVLLLTLCLCLCRWNRTLAMNKALCASIGDGAFPSPAMLVQAGAGRLQTECGVGYRAKSLLRLAEQVTLLSPSQHALLMLLFILAVLLCMFSSASAQTFSQR